MTHRASDKPVAGGRGEQMHRLMRELFPLHRSQTGAGVRQSLQLLQSIVPLEVHEVDSGTSVFGWTVPNEWTIRDAWISNAQGKRLVDYQLSNLHVVGNSQGIRERMSFAKLQPYLHSLPEHPDWIPYRTKYFQEGWGFCLSDSQLDQFRQAGPDAEYEVCIDADLRPGSLSYGELFLPGETDEQVLVSTHTCHPSLANDNLSGIVVAAFLAAQLQHTPQRLSYRFLFLPGTIGPITWLALNREVIPRIHHGLVLACLGDAGPMTYKRSRQGKAAIDQAVELVLRDRGAQHEIRDFSPTGFDERQYCSPGFNLPVGRLTRTAEGEFAEYHSSSDNLELVRPEYLANSLDCCMEIFAALDANIVYQNRHPWCEPRLGSAGLYDTYGADNPMRAALQEAVQWVLSFSDQQHSLLDIAQRSGLPLAELREAAERLVACELIHRANKSQG